MSENRCRHCGTNDGMHVAAAFCPTCSIKMIPKCHPCQECGRPFSTSAIEETCEKCRGFEYQQWLVSNWPELRKYP